MDIVSLLLVNLVTRILSVLLHCLDRYCIALAESLHGSVLLLAASSFWPNAYSGVPTHHFCSVLIGLLVLEAIARGVSVLLSATFDHAAA